MRWIARVFVSAAVRRIAVVCVLALLGLFGIGTARAASYPDQGAAWSACLAANDQHIAAFKVAIGPDDAQHVTGRCEWEDPRYLDNYASRLFLRGNYYASMGEYSFPMAKTCAARPDVTGLGPWSTMVSTREGTTQCDSGCWRSWYSNGDGTMTGKTTLGAVCSGNNEASCAAIGGGMYFNPAIYGCELPEVETCPVGQQKNAAGDCVVNQCPSGMVEGPTGTCINEKNECPAGEVKSPTGQCLPGDGQCAQGEARRPNGTCGKDFNGDGVADDDDDNPDNDTDKETFSGGDNCTSPPSCSGSPVACGQARIQWRIECNTRRNETIAGGACNAMPICKGEKCNAMEYSQLLQQWKAACALEKLVNQQPGQGGGGDNSDLIAYLSSGGTVNTDAMGNGGIEVGDPWGGGTGSPGDDFQPDGSGFGYSSSCPTFPVVNVMGTSLDFNNGPLCDWLALGGQLVLILAALASLRIVAGSAA